MLETADALARGRGLTCAQVKVSRTDGSVEYHMSRPKLRAWDPIGWAWYLAHRRDLIRGRP